MEEITVEIGERKVKLSLKEKRDLRWATQRAFKVAKREKERADERVRELEQWWRVLKGEEDGLLPDGCEGMVLTALKDRNPALVTRVEKGDK